MHLAFIYVDDVRVMDGGHDLNLPPDPYEICLRLDFRLLDRLDGHLKTSTIRFPAAVYDCRFSEEGFPPGSGM